MLFIICIALAYAIQEACTQTWGHVKRTVSAAAKQRRATAQKKIAEIRKSGTTTAGTINGAVTVGSGLAATIAALWSVGRGIGRSFVSGWRAGWAKGRTKAEAWQARRQKPVPAGCASCKHGTPEQPYRSDCGCGNDGCACTSTPERPAQRLPSVVVTGGSAVGVCSICEHPYRSGRVEGCSCQNERCPCRRAGDTTGRRDRAPRKATLAKAGG